MTKQEAIKWKPEIEAFQQGKTIQILYRRWVDCVNPSFSLKSKYRVKPTQTKRLPTIQEVEQWFLENKVFAEKMTYGSGECPTLTRIQTFAAKYQKVFIHDSWYFINGLCDDFLNVDGSELYITEQ